MQREQQLCQDFTYLLVVIPLVTLRVRESCHASVLLKADDEVITALAGLGVGVYPSPTVISGCEKIFCQQFNSAFV